MIRFNVPMKKNMLNICYERGLSVKTEAVYHSGTIKISPFLRAVNT